MTPIAWDPRDRSGLVPRRRGTRRPLLFVIAVEGRVEEPAYFGALEPLVARRVVVVLPPTDDPNAPIAERGNDPVNTLERLLAYATQEIPAKLGGGDEFWLVVDVDRHRGLGPALRRVRQKGPDWAAAVSNPCFEVWLQLHFVDQPMLQGTGAASQRAKRAWRALRTHHEPIRWTRSLVEAAVARGQAANHHGDVPPEVGSHVHRLVARLLEP